MDDCSRGHLFDGDTTPRRAGDLSLIGDIRTACFLDQDAPKHGEVGHAFILDSIATRGQVFPPGAE